MRSAAVAVAVALAALACGCAAAPPAPEVSLVGTTWVLDRIVSADGPTVRGTGAETLAFGADGRLAVASCNACTGPYRLSRGALEPGEALACTRRGCPNGAIELERYLDGRQSLRRDGEFLVVAPEAGSGAWLVFLPSAGEPR